MMRILSILTVLCWGSVQCIPRRYSSDVIYEGDLALTKLQAIMQYPKKEARKVVLDIREIWPNALVKYRIHQSARWYKRHVEKAIRNIRNHTCINFVEIHDENDLPYLLFTDNGRCYSFVGKVFDKEPQTLTMSKDCTDVGLYMVHEICHALGLYHEHRRPDRDQYITVFEENIDEKYRYTFTINEAMKTFGIPYDVTSVMHYPYYAFSKNDKPAMLPKDISLQPYMGYSSTLRFSDMKALNLLYQCNADHCSDLPKCPKEGFRDPMCKCVCPHNTPWNKCSEKDNMEPCCDIIIPLKY